MYPNFDTITNNPEGLKNYQIGYAAYKSLPSFINDNFKEGLSNEETESVALFNAIKNNEFITADEFGSEKSRLSDLGLDRDLLGNTLLRKSLGYLSSKDELDKFADNTEGNTRNNFMKIMKGRTDEVLKQLKDKEEGDFQVYSYFVPTVDPETGELTLKQVVGTKEALGKIELAGASAVNSYGPKQFSSGNGLAGFASGITKGFASGIHDIYPSVLGAASAVSNTAESMYNLATKGEYKSDYNNLDALYDYRKMEENMDVPYYKSTIKQDKGAFNNLESFGAALGNGLSSLVGYATYGRALGGLGFGTLGSMWGAGMILNGGEAYQAAKEAGLDDASAAGVMMFTGAINTLVEQKLGSNKLLQWLATGKSGKTAARAIVNEVGGDISKLSDRNIQNKIANGIVSTIDRITNAGIIGSAFEEGLEEGIQSTVKSNVEFLYDKFIANSDAEVGKGKFGTDVTDADTWKQAVEEAGIGAIIGGIGGFVHSKTKEDTSIIPYIASGEYESLMAGLNLALSKGAISQEQYDGVKNRAEVLNTIYNDNKSLFAQVASQDKDKQMELSEIVMKQLRDQDDYIKSTENGVQDNYQKFNDLLKKSMTITTKDGESFAISTANRFEESLRNAGRKEEANIISTSRNDAKKKIKDILPKPKKFKDDNERVGWIKTKKQIEDFIYKANIDLQLNRERNKAYLAENKKQLAENQELRDAFDTFLETSGYSDLLKNSINSIKESKTSDDVDNSYKTAVKGLISKLTSFAKDNAGIIGIKDFIQNQLDLNASQLLDQAYKTQIKKLTTDNTEVKNLLNENINTRKQLAEIVRIAAERAAAEARVKQIDDYYNSEEYKNKLDSVINDDNTSEEDKVLYQNAKNGSIDAQIEILNREKKLLTEELNNTPINETDVRESLKNQLADYNEKEKYLNKKKIEADKEAADNVYNPIDLDLSSYGSNVLVDENGETYALDTTGTKRSNKNGFSFTLVNSKNNEKIEVKQQDLLKYKDNNTGESLAMLANRLEEEYQKSLSSDKDLKGTPGDDYEPTESKASVAPKAPNTSVVARLAADSKFNSIINNPKTDVSKFSIELEVSKNIDNLDGYQNEKWAKKLFSKLIESSNPVEDFNNLSDSDRNKLLKFLPIQGTIVNKNYKNVVYTFSDVSEIKTALIIRMLSNNGKLSIPAGSIKRTAGYLNYQKGESNNLKSALKLKNTKDGLAFPDGSPVRIGIADSTGAIFYPSTDPSSDSLSVANATGTPGSPYLIIPASYQLTGEDGYVAKLNPSKISKELADILAKIFADIAAKKINLSDAISEDNDYNIKLEEAGYLTYGKLLNQLIFFGDRTIKSTREPNKILYIDYKNGGLIKYGANQDVLDPSSKESIAKFSLWISNNKNYSLSRKSLNGVESDTIEQGFSIIGTDGKALVNFRKGESYLNSIISNGFINTDLSIDKGLINKSYLYIDNLPAPSTKKVTSDNIPVDTKSGDSKSAPVKTEINLNEAPLTNDQLKALPDGTSIVAKIENRQKYANKVGLIKKGNKLVSIDGRELVDLDSENVDKDTRKALVDEFNKKIDEIVQYENEHPESSMEEEDGKKVRVSSIGLKINTTRFVKEGVYETIPDYYKKISKIKISTPAPVKNEAGALNKPKKDSKKAQVNTNSFGLSLSNPFVSVEQTDEVKKLSDRYEKLINELSKAPSKEMYISNVNMILQNPMNMLGFSKEEIVELINYVFPDGVSVGRILLNLGKYSSTTSEQPNPIESKKDKELDKTNKKKSPTEVKTETVSDDITVETPVYKIAKLSSNEDRFNELLKKYENEKDNLGVPEMKELLNELNSLIESQPKLSNFEIYNNFRADKLGLRVRKNKEVVKDDENIKDKPVVQPSTPEELNEAAGITPEMTGMERKKPKGKFGSFNRKASVPMQTSANDKVSYNLSREITRFRRMLGKKAGGDIKIVDKLIKVIGESGRPGWAWAIMNEDGVTLYEKPAEGAIYHEAFHRVSLLLLSPEEQKQLYKQARKEYSLYNRSDNEVEEFLAEKFRESVLSERNEKGFVGRILSNIKNFIKTFLGLNKTKIDGIDSFFKAIRDGKYKYAKINKAALISFNNRYTNADVPLSINGITLDRIYNSSILTNIVNTLTAMTIDVNGIQDIESLSRGISFKDVKNQLITLRDKHLAASENEAFDEITRMNYKSKVDLYNEIIDNFETVFVPLIDVKLQGYNIKRIENKLNDKDDLNDLVNDEIRSSYEFSAKENAQADVRIMFLTLKSSEEYDPVTLLPMYVNPDIAWFNTFSAVHNANSIQEMLDILKKKSEETNTIRQSNGISSKINMYSELYEILTMSDEDGNQDEMLKTRFWNTFKKHKNAFVNAYFSLDSNEKGKKLSSYDITFGDADVNKRSIKLERNWSATFGVTGKFSDKELLKNAVKRYKALADKSKKSSFLRGDNYTSAVDELVSILNSIDIAVDSNTIGVLLNQHYKDSNLNRAISNLLNSVPKKGKTDSVGLNQMFLGENGIIQKLINDDIENIEEKALELLSSEKATIEIAKSYVAANPTAEDDSVLGPSGNLVYAYSENNTITSMFEEWIKDDAFFNQLRAVTYNKASLWLQQLENKSARNKVHVETMLSMIGRDEYDTGRGYLEIAPNEDLLLKFNAVLNDKLPLPTLANKRTFYFITGLKRLEVRLQDGNLNKEVIDAFTNYAICEYATIKEAERARDKFLSKVGVDLDTWNKMSKKDQDALMKEKGVNYKDLVENYHYIMKGNMKLTGNGYKFRYFISLQDKLNDDEFFDINNKALRKRISNSLNQQVNNTIKLFINQKLISGNEKYSDSEEIKRDNSNSSSVGINTKMITRNNLLPNKLIKSKQTEKIDLATAIADYAINSAIAVYEFEKLVSGDVAYYKGSKNYQAMLDDRVKRYSALTSTKSVLRQEWPQDFLDFNTDKYKVSIFSSNIVESKVMYDEMMSKYVGTDGNHGLLWKQFEMFREKGIGRFANMTDEQIKEEALKEADRRLNGYLETDQTDAQVLISPKMFRKLAIMNGEWNEEKEAAYDLMESDEDLTIEQELEAYSVIMQPLKYIHFGYDFFNGLQVPIYDKMSLATVFKRVAKGRDLQKVYDFMRDNDVDMIKFDTAVKSGLRQKGTFYDNGKPTDNLNDTPIYEQSFKYLGKQLVTDPHHVSRIALGTQMAKIGIAGVEDDAEYEFDGKTYKGSQLVKDYVDAISTLSDIGKRNIKEQFGITEVVDENGNSTFTIDKNKFVQMLKDDAISSNLPSNLIDVLKTVNNDNGTEDYYIELSGIPALAWIQSRLISMIKKETIDINTPGGSMIQMSNFAFKDSFIEKDTSDYNYKLNKELRFKDENGRLEAVVSINLFKDLLPKAYLIEEAKKNGTTYFEEARKFILSNNNLAALSYRIPTQGMNSTLPITVVDVLPSNVGDTIILPAELTKLTGADFDVDKMYLARYNYESVGGKLYKIEFIDDFEGYDDNGNPIYLDEDEYLEKLYNYNYRWFGTDFYKKALEDIPKILGSARTDVTRNGNISEDSLNLLKAMQEKYSAFIGKRKFDSIINDNTLSPRDKIMKLASSFKLESRKKTLEEFKNENRGKSKWELNNSSQVENRLLDIFQTTLTSDNHYMDATVPLDFATDALKVAVNDVDKYSNLNKDYNDTEPLFPLYQEGIKTQNVGADAGIGPMALINTFRVIMQIAKLNLDKTIKIKSRRGKNYVSRNLVALIPNINNLYDKYDSDGVSIMDWTSALINAHVDAAKDSYITRLNVNSYTYDVVALLTSSGVGLSQFYFLPQPILKEIAEESIRRSSSKIGISKKDRRDTKWRDAISSKYIKNAKLSKSFYDDLDSGKLNIEWKGNKYNASDLIFNKEWLLEQLKNHYEGNMDSDWYRNQIIIFEYFKDIQNYSKALSNLVLASQVDTGKMGKNLSELILSLHNIERMQDDVHFTNAEDVYNKTFLGKKMNNSTGLLFDLLKSEMLEFSPGFLKMVNLFGKLSDTYYDRDPRNINQYMYEMKFAMQAEFFNEFCKQNNINLKDMFYGDNTIVDKVNKIRNIVLSNNGYFELADNMLLKMLIPAIQVKGKPKKFETVLKLRDTDAKNAYTYAWRDLLEHSDPEISKIAKELIVYSFYTSGGRGTGIYATLDLVPFEVLGNLSYTKDGVDYTYNQHLKDLLKRSNSNTLDFNKYMEYAFKASKDNDDIVQPVQSYSSSSLSSEQVENGKTIYFTAVNGDLVTADKTPLPFLKKDDNLYKLVGLFKDSNGEVEPVYALTDSINYKERGFTINEGTNISTINDSKDYTDLSVPFTNKFKDNRQFIKIDNIFDIEDTYSAPVEEDEDSVSSDEQTTDSTSQNNNVLPITKIISGGQTGVDTIGLQVAKELGIETGGTAPKGFLREEGIDNEDIRSYNLVEITDEEQEAYSKSTKKYDPYTGRTDLNVRNSDGTVYFYTSEDKRGFEATERSAIKHKKPFLPNPTAEELREWIIKNNIKTLNVAGNRGSKLAKDNNVANILREALSSSTSNAINNANAVSNEFTWADKADNSFEVSTKGGKGSIEGDKRFSAKNATFKPGTVIDGVDVSNMSIEDVYQDIIKKSGKGQAPSKDSRLNLLNSDNYSTTFKNFPEGVTNVFYNADDEVPRVVFKAPNGEIGLIQYENKKWRISRKQKSPKGEDVFYSEQLSPEVIDKVVSRFIPNKFREYVESGQIYKDNVKDFQDNKGRVQNFFRENYNVHLINQYFLEKGKHETFEDFSYYEAYLPLWQEWARQNPELIEELREKAKGKVLTDMFANTRVSQARALADILNSTANTSNNDNTINELAELGEKRQKLCGV